ncbi:MAG: hypothetical protein PHP85_07265 [Gallionella sp.]|nr:hypothetical protein [Gallionella sp.]
MRYLIHFFLATLLLSASLAGFNYWIDPYAIYHEPTHHAAPLHVMNERIFKTVKLARMSADVVFIGTSRTDIGIGREQTALPGKSLLNLSIFDQRIHETRRLIEIMVQDGRPHKIVLGLDFFAFNVLNAPPSDYTEDNGNPLRPLTLLLSVSTLVDAMTKYRHPQTSDGDCCDADGFRLPTKTVPGNYRQKFSASERLYLMEKYLPYPQCKFAFSSAGLQTPSSLSDMQAILALAQRRHIDLRLFISPSHARQWQTLAAAGLWDDWENWKRKLVALNEQEAANTGRSAFPLWDFSGYDAVSTEELPDENELRPMSGYSDSSHYVPAIGQRLVTRIFGGTENWGVSLNHSNIEENLQRIRADRKRYLSGHTRDVSEIEALARDTAHAKHCAEPIANTF